MQWTRLFSIGLMMGLVLTLSACGGKDEKKEEKKDGANAKKEGENKGGSGGGAKTLVGKWEMDMTPMIKMMETQLAQVPDEVKGQIQEQIEKMKSAKVGMEFTSDGKMIGTQSGGPNGSKTDNGTYEVKSSEGDTMVVMTKMGKDKEEEITLTFLSADTIEFTTPAGAPPGMDKITAHRVK